MERKWSNSQKAGACLIVGMIMLVSLGNVLGVVLPFGLLVYVLVLVVGVVLLVRKPRDVTR